MNETLATDRSSRDWRIWFGVASTAFWLWLGGLYVTMVVGFGDFVRQPADAIGGFLEGAFAPLAFLWLVIGFFLQQAAETGYYQVLMRNALEGHLVREVMQPDVVTVEADTPVGTAVNDYFMRFRFNSFPVLENGRLVGVLTTHDLKDVPGEEWDSRYVKEIMETGPAEHALSPDDSAYGALMKIAQDGMGRLPVVEDGVVVGIVSNRDIMKLLKFKMDIGH